jgi:hypothetical protein
MSTTSRKNSSVVPGPGTSNPPSAKSATTATSVSRAPKARSVDLLVGDDARQSGPAPGALGAEPSNQKSGPNCWGCRYFAVSWDPHRPYACNLMGFKTKMLPSIEVLRTDGRFCQGFVPKA